VPENSGGQAASLRSVRMRGASAAGATATAGEGVAGGGAVQADIAHTMQGNRNRTMSIAATSPRWYAAPAAQCSVRRSTAGIANSRPTTVRA
jgi:hypothetical protein